MWHFRGDKAYVLRWYAVFGERVYLTVFTYKSYPACLCVVDVRMARRR